MKPLNTYSQRTQSLHFIAFIVALRNYAYIPIIKNKNCRNGKVATVIHRKYPNNPAKRKEGLMR